MKPFHAITALTLLLLAAGCQTTGSSWNPLSRTSTKPAEQPTRIVAIWAPDVLNTQGQPSTQGFGGRLYFYDENNRTMPVDGQLVIHAYDDSEDADHTTADKKFVFTAEQLKRHHGLCELGSSYSIWIPWQAVGGTRRSISLVPTFTSANGIRLVGHQTKNVLPGKKPPQAETKQKDYAAHKAPHHANPVSPVGYPGQQAADPTKARTLDYTTTTINVPRSLSQQMRNPTGMQPGLARHDRAPLNQAANQPLHTQPHATGVPMPAPVGSPAAQNPVLPPTGSPRKPAASHFRPAWVPYGTPLNGPGTRQAGATTSRQLP